MGTVQKIYVAIFVFMATNAVHIEFVSDLTSQVAIAPLKKLSAYRGKSSITLNDNVMYFTGASAELKRMHKLMLNIKDISSLLVSDGIRCKFLPPKALWSLKGMNEIL